MDYRVKKFIPQEHAEIWNSFIGASPSANFMFHRDYMGYHAQRFTDHSLLIFDEKDKLQACLPANQSGNVVHSHEGLTYGGMICKPRIKIAEVHSIFSGILSYYKENGIEKLAYKAYPRFYNPFQSDEISYALFRIGAQLVRRNTAFVVDRGSKIPYSENIRRAAKKASKVGFISLESDDVARYWTEILNPHLKTKFDTRPVHSIDEIKVLKDKFPDKIKLHIIADSSGNWQAGTLLYISTHVIHCQYISYKQEAKNNGSLDLLFTGLIDYYLPEKRFFDLGTANAPTSSQLNQGLAAWKERMGGRARSHDFFEIMTENYHLL